MILVFKLKMLFLYLLCFIGIIYYRRFLFLKLFSLFLELMKWKIENFNKVKDDVFIEKGCESVGEYIIKEYDVVYNNKSHSIIFTRHNKNNGNINEQDDFQSNITKYLLNKSMIVNCSITNNNGDIIIDTTEDFRKFCYYYKKEVILLPFFNCIQNKIESECIFDYNFTIYLNDSEFTEYNYCIRDNMHSNFKMLFESKKFV